MAKRIITISREFGSGGRFIGEEIAKKLGIAYYDKNIISKIAEKSGLSPEYIQEKAELSTRPGIDPEIIKGAAPTKEHTSHVSDTTKNPSLDLNFSGEGLMVIRISTPARIQKPITVPNPKTDDFSL